MKKLFLAIHFGHDSNVAVVDENGDIKFAISEERLIRIKQYPGFPSLGLKLINNLYGSDFESLLTVRLPKFKKLIRDLHFLLNSKIKGLNAPSFRFWFKNIIRKVKKRALESKGSSLLSQFNFNDEIINIEHHFAHAGSAFYASGFNKALIVTLDGEGDNLSCAIYRADTKRGIERIEAYFANEVTIGRDYEKVTAMLGFHPLRHPGKITGLAAYTEPKEECIFELEKFLSKFWKGKSPEGFLTTHAYQTISNKGRIELQKARKKYFSKYSDADLAAAIQAITERKVIDIIRKFKTKEDENIALAGGVFANVKLNKKVKELGFKNIFIQPAMSDQGLAVGSILYYLGKYHNLKPFRFKNVYFGVEYSQEEIKKELEKQNISYQIPSDPAMTVAKLLAEGKVVALFQGRLEFGPRALGNRSVLYQTTDVTVNDWLNKKLARTEFMPFAPVTLYNFAEKCYKNLSGAEYTAKFMTITFDCTDWMKKTSPAVVHIDGTARPQILYPDDNPLYYQILLNYYKLTGIPNLINTSFNMHDEPIVCSPYDAIRAFRASKIDALLIGNFLVLQ